MVRALRAHACVPRGWPLLAALLAVAMLVPIDLLAPASVQAGSPSSDVRDIRARQLRAEATMLRADRQVKRLQRQRSQHAKRLRAAKRQLDLAIERRDRARRGMERAGARLDHVEQVLARTVLVRPNPSGRQATDKPALRRQASRLELRATRVQRRLRALERTVERARSVKQARAKKVGRARIEARRSARQRAEEKLGASIIAMLELSQARADERLGAGSVERFRRPARGAVSQRYGCTGYRVNPPRGSCPHFHDGLDIATPRGAPVRASAAGYVAYVGRNPWDGGKRSFVVIIGHAGGFETVYAHLLPARRVRAGQRVERGDLVGRVGMTGRTSGPHVHWEVRRAGQSLNPLRAGA